MINKYINEFYQSKQSISSNEKIMCSCVLYGYISSMNITEFNDIRSLIESHASNVMTWVIGLKNVYISYELMEFEINKINKSFITYTITDIKNIIKIYNDKTKVAKFSNQDVSPEMYRLSKVSFKDRNKLSNLHYNFMVEISRYYTSQGLCNASDVTVLYVNENFNYVIFYIEGIDHFKIYNDISLNRIKTTLEIQNIKIKTNYVHVLIKNN